MSDFKVKTVGEYLTAAMAVQTQEEADACLKDMVDYKIACAINFPDSFPKYASAEIRELDLTKMVRQDIGYYAGYHDADVRERVERLFACEHPYFGSIKERGQPSLQDAFDLGVALGAKMQATKEKEKEET